MKEDTLQMNRHPDIYVESIKSKNESSVLDSEDGLNCLMLTTRRSEIFQRIWNKNEKISLLSLFHQMEVQKGEVIVEYGSSLHTFYVIDEGAFEVLSPKEKGLSIEELNKEESWEREAILYENEHIGEPALENAILTRISKQVFSPYRIRCVYPSLVWYISDKTFLERWDFMQERILGQIKSGLSKVPQFEKFINENPEKALPFILQCKVADLEDHECVISEGYLGRHIYIVLKGTFSRYQEDHNFNPLGKYLGVYSTENRIFGMESIEEQPFKETVITSGPHNKLVVIPANFTID